MNDFSDQLSMYRGDSYRVTDKLSVRQPTLQEICDFGESNYMRLLSTVLAHPFDMIAQLHKIGIDFTEITEFELFCLIMPSLKPEKTSILFGDVDFTTLRTYKLKESDELIAANKDGVVINQYNYQLLCEFLRKIHNFKHPKFNQVGNEATKRMMIEEALDDFQRKSSKPESSMLAPLASSLVNCADFKHTWHNVWDLTVYQFFDAVRRIETHENANHLYTGLYSGCIELQKVRKDLNWMKEL